MEVYSYVIKEGKFAGQEIILESYTNADVLKTFKQRERRRKKRLEKSLSKDIEKC